VLTSAANVNDSMVFKELLDAIKPIKRPRGRPRKRPEKLHADKAYDDRPKVRPGAQGTRHQEAHIARKKIESFPRSWGDTGGW
jgi:hypothetical protein